MVLLKKFNGFINSLLEVGMVVCFMSMVVLIFLQVVCRYVLNDALSWSEELASYFFHWATFVGASVAFYENTHISVGYFVNHVPSLRLRAFLLTVADICCLWFLGLYIVEGWKVTKLVFSFGETATSMTWLPMGFIHLAIPLASLFMALNVLAYLIEHLRVLCTGTENNPPATAQASGD